MHTNVVLYKVPMKFKVDVQVISVENVPSKADRVVVSVARGPKIRTTKDAVLYNQENSVEPDEEFERGKKKKKQPRSFKIAGWDHLSEEETTLTQIVTLYQENRRGGGPVTFEKKVNLMTIAFNAMTC